MDVIEITLDPTLIMVLLVWEAGRPDRPELLLIVDIGTNAFQGGSDLTDEAA
jgi:hypothetical protein